MKIWNGFVLILAGVILAGSVKALLSYWQYDLIDPLIPQLMSQQVSTQQLNKAIQQAIQANDPEEARRYLHLAQLFHYPIDATAYEPALKTLESPVNVAKRTLNDFASGFIHGQAESSAGVAGALTSDFTVVGDARDLWEQYQLYVTGQQVNDLVVTLAGIGVGLTVATIASSGIAAPAKGGVSTTKVAARLGHLTPSFQKTLLKQTLAVFDYQKFFRAAKTEGNLDGMRRAALEAYNPKAIHAIEQTAEQVNGMRKASSTADAIYLLKFADTPDDLAKLEKLTVKYGADTKGIMQVLGKTAIRSVKVLRKSTELLMSIIASVLSFIGLSLSFTGLFKSKS